MTTPDGVRLDADVWRPDAPGRLPVLLMRQPYGRRIASTLVYAHPAWYAARGYIVAIQDVRGTGISVAMMTQTVMRRRLAPPPPAGRRGGPAVPARSECTASRIRR